MIRANSPISDFMSVVQWTVSPSDTVSAAGEKMKQHDVRHLPVLRDGEMVGIISALDLIRVTAEVRDAALVEDIMTTDVESFDADTSIRQVLDRLTVVPYDAFPITRDGELVGIVTSTDLEALLFRDF